MKKTVLKIACVLVLTIGTGLIVGYLASHSPVPHSTQASAVPVEHPVADALPERQPVVVEPSTNAPLVLQASVEVQFSEQ